MAAINVLSAQSLASIIARSLPRGSSPQIKSGYDAIALATHAAMIAVGFRLIGLTEDDRVAESQWTDVRPLPDQWNIQSPANHSFRYAHPQSSMQFLVKVNRLGSKAVVMGMGIGHDKTISYDVKVDDYTSPNSLPSSPTPADMPAGPVSSDDSALNNDQSAELSRDIKQKVIDVFISQGRLADYGALVRLRLIQKLIPSVQKDGYEETPAGGEDNSNNYTDGSLTRQRPPTHPSHPPISPEPATPYPLADDPLRLPSRQPRVSPGEFGPPGFEDEHEILRPPWPLGRASGGGGAALGQRDLYPQGLGPNDPFRSMGPGLGGPGGGGAGGGGMHPTFDDPLFHGRTGNDYGDEGSSGYDVQAPPGARYDPVGPGAAPRGAARGGGRPGGGRLGGPPNPFGGFGGGDFI